MARASSASAGMTASKKSKLWTNAARAAFVQSLDFFDAVMPADAELARAMIQDTVVADGTSLENAYRDAVDQVPSSARKLDSTVTQLLLLADFVRCRRRDGDADVAATL